MSPATRPESCPSSGLSQVCCLRPSQGQRAAAAQGSCGLHGPHDTVSAAGASLTGAVAITVMEKAASSTSVAGDMSLKLAVLGYTCRQHKSKVTRRAYGGELCGAVTYRKASRPCLLGHQRSAAGGGLSRTLQTSLSNESKHIAIGSTLHGAELACMRHERKEAHVMQFSMLLLHSPECASRNRCVQGFAHCRDPRKNWWSGSPRQSAPSHYRWS